MTTTTVKPESPASIAFPSVAWFRRLGELMHAQRDVFVHLGYIDCTMQVTIIDGGPEGVPWNVQLRFEEYDLVEVVESGDVATADFIVECDLETWAEMVRSIEAGGGRPDLEHTLNFLSLPAVPMRVWSTDPLRRDLFFRVNQSLQAFVDNCGRFTTSFPAGTA